MPKPSQASSPDPVEKWGAWPTRKANRGASWLPIVLLVAAATVSAIDLQRTEARTMVIYTTPALQDFLEKEAIPNFTKATGQRVTAVYLAAGDEYYRVKLSKDRPEADLFLHASPLYMEKGLQAGLFNLTTLPGNQTYLYNVEGAAPWHAFAWSPLVEVYGKGQLQPDIATLDGRYGLAHPRLSNNGIYVAILLGAYPDQVRQHALERTVVQPTNARATIQGVADGSYEVTIGYEAVASYYKSLGAKVSYEVPLVQGERVTAPVLFSAGLVAHHPHPGAEAFLQYLMEPNVQAHLAKFGMRSVIEGTPAPTGAIDLAGARTINFDWHSDWQTLESSLPKYEVNK